MTQDSFRPFVPLPLTEYKKLKWEQNRVPFRRHGAHALCLRTFLICSQWWRETAAYNGVSFAVHYWYGRTKGMIVLQTFWSTRRVCGITVRWQTFRHLLAVSVLWSFSAPQVSFRDWEDNVFSRWKSVAALLLHLLSPSQHCCSSDMLNKQAFLSSLLFSYLSADRRVPGDPEDNWHRSIRGNISVICISSDYRLWWHLSWVFRLFKSLLPKLQITPTHNGGEKPSSLIFHTRLPHFFFFFFF